ncbi:MAG: hypothetical protein IK092_01295 [Muribaculaceae bacterium]|nr:hypothetical protein [Muribaculaceae bacterium]
MNKIIIFALAVLALLGTSCGNSKDKELGEKFAQQFAQQWDINCPDSAQACLAAYNAMCDSVSSKSSFDNGFIAQFDQNDTLRIAASLITLSDEDFGKELADRLVQSLLDKSITQEQAKRRVSLVQATTTALNREKAQKEWERAVQEKVNDLSTSKQMQVYDAASTPQELGAALAADAKKPNADINLINDQIEALRGIYNPQDFQTFYNTYNSNK